MSEEMSKRAKCIACIEKIIDRNHADKIKTVADYLFSLSSKIDKYEVVCYETDYPDVRFTIVDPTDPPKKNRPFLVFRNQMEIHMLLDKDFANKYPFLEFIDSPKNFYKIRAPEGRDVKVEALIEIAHDALLSRCNSLKFSISIEIPNSKNAEPTQHGIGSYIPSNKDVENTLVDLGGTDISKDRLLAEIEKKFKDKGLKEDWREITIRNLEIWANQG